MPESAYFQVSVPIELRSKLERMARGSMRSLGNVVSALIAKEDEAAPEWNIVPQEEPDAGESESEAVD